MNKINLTTQYRTRNGNRVRILCVDRRSTDYPVVGFIVEKYDDGKLYDDMNCWTATGKYHADVESGENDLVEYNPAFDLVEDQKIWVRDFESHRWVPRHFAVYKEEKVWSFPDGTSSHTYDAENDILMPWKLFTTVNPNK